MANLLVTFAADGTSNNLAVRNYVGPASRFEFTVFYVGSSMGGGTIKLQASPDGGTTWVDIPNSSSTTTTCMNMEIRATHIRANMAGSTSPSVSVYIL